MKLKLFLSTTITLLFITGCSKSEHSSDTKTVLPKQAPHRLLWVLLNNVKAIKAFLQVGVKIQRLEWCSFQMDILILALKKLIQMSLTLGKTARS